MLIWQLLLFGFPSFLVILMSYIELRGVKTYTQAGLVFLVALNETDFNFLPSEYSMPLLAGIAVATALARVYTQKGK